MSKDEIINLWSIKINKQLDLTMEFVIDINNSEQLKSDNNKDYQHFVKDLNTLEGAVKNPYNSYYESNIDILTEIFYRIVKNHPFNDGNKRTALVSISLYIITSMFNILNTEIDYKIVNAIIDIIFKDTDRIVALMVSIANTNQLNNEEGVNITKAKIKEFISEIINVSYKTIEGENNG